MTRLRFLLVAALALVPMLLAPASTAAQGQTRCSAQGSGTRLVRGVESGPDRVVDMVEFVAQSDACGLNARGRYREREYFGGSQGPTRGEFSGDVTCLTVTGKSATFYVRVTSASGTPVVPQPSPGATLKVDVTDTDQPTPVHNLITVTQLAVAPPVCPPPANDGTATFVGPINVRGGTQIP
jgi:hypothetical protein